MTLRLEDSSESATPTLDIDLLGILARRFHWVATGLSVGCLMAVLFYWKQTPIYESEMVVLVSQRTSELASKGTLSQANASSIQDEILATQAELLGSRKLVDAAVASAKLDVSSIEEVLANLSITKGGSGLAKNAAVLRATFRGPNPEKNARLLQALYDSYQAYTTAQSKVVGTEAADLLTEALANSQTELRELESQYREFIQNLPELIQSRGAGGGELRDVHSHRLASIEAELAEIRASLADVQARQEIVQEFVASRVSRQFSQSEVLALLTESDVNRLLGFTEILADRFESNDQLLSKARHSEAARVEYQRLLELLGKEKVLTAHYGSSHPSVGAVRAEIAEIRDFIHAGRTPDAAGESERQVAPSEMLAAQILILNNDLAALKKRELELLRSSDEESRLAKDVDMQLLVGNSLKSNLQRAQTRYDEVFQRLQEVKLTNAYAGFSAELLSLPMPGSKPVWPSKTRIGILGLLFGGMCGVAWALLCELTDKAFRSPADVERAAGVSIMTHLPRLACGAASSATEDRKIQPAIITYHEPHSSEAESFRVLRTELLYQAKRDQRQVFMVTSPSPSDGKSTTIANLAVSLAQAGRRVLLVDADLRRPAIAGLFGIRGESGLADYLEDGSSFVSCCQSSDLSNLTICGHGSFTSRPTELLESTRFHQFVAEARERFDLIMFDTPPLLAVPDPLITAELVDGCLLVVRIEKQGRHLVERACQLLSEHCVPVLGIVVNAAHSRRRNYGYSTYNYYGKHAYGYEAPYRQKYVLSENATDVAVGRRDR